jgi:hypothetical protein
MKKMKRLIDQSGEDGLILPGIFKNDHGEEVSVQVLIDG